MKDSNDNKPGWRRVMIMALLPLTIFIWMTGWTLYWIGDQRISSKTAQNEAMNSFNQRDYERKNVNEASSQQILA